MPSGLVSRLVYPVAVSFQAPIRYDQGCGQYGIHGGHRLSTPAVG
jgi:hypothetical protein